MSRCRLLLLVGLVGLIGWLFWPVLAGSRTFVFRDAAHYFPPLFDFNMREWHGGRVPLWDPLEHVGLPALGENTASVFYPGQLLLVLLPHRLLWAYNLYLVSHVVLAAWGAYLLARRLQTSTLAAAQAALAYAFGGAVLFQHCNVVFLISAAWLPFALAAVLRLFERNADGHDAGVALVARRGPFWSAAWLGIILGLMVLGGDPQMAYNVMLLAGLYAAALAWYERRGLAGERGAAVEHTVAGHRGGGGRSAWILLRGRLLWLFAAGALGGLLAAVQILPTWELASLSPRTIDDQPRSAWELASRSMNPLGDEADMLARSHWSAMLNAETGGEHLRRVYQFSQGPWRWLELVWPNVGGRQFPTYRRWFSAIWPAERIWTPGIYCGVIALVFAWGGWRLRKSDARWRWLGWMLVFAALASLGQWGPGWLFGQYQQASGHAASCGPELGGLYWWMNILLPGYVAFRYPAKLWTIAALAFSMFAARGWDAAWGQPSTADSHALPTTDESRAARLRFWWLGAFSGGAALLALLGRHWFLAYFADAAPDPLFGPFDAAGAGTDLLGGFVHSSVVCCLAAILLRLRTTGQRSLAAGCLLALSAAELAHANNWLVPSIDTAAWQSTWLTTGWSANRPQDGVPPSIDRPDLEAGVPPRIYRPRELTNPAWSRSASDRRLAEIFAWDRETLWPKYHLLLNVGSVESSGMLLPDEYLAWWEIAGQGDDPPGDRDSPDSDADDHRRLASVCKLLGAQWLIAPSDWRLAGDFEPLDDKPGTAAESDAQPSAAAWRVWRDSKPGPRAWTVHRVELLPELPDRRPASIRRRTAAVLFPGGQPRAWQQEAVVESGAPLPYPPSEPATEPTTNAPRESCQITHADPQHVVVATELAAPGLLVVSDLFYPGWEVTVDDGHGPTRSRILRTDRLLRGVSLPAGKWQVDFRYRPATFCGGATLTVGTLLILMVAGLVRTGWRGLATLRRRPPPGDRSVS